VRMTDAEVRAMNRPLRRLAQRWIEMPLFRLAGLRVEDRDVLEVGCGSGYGAVLLSRLRPRSYLGIDLMPEQIELARRRGELPGVQFALMDASEMPGVPDASKDVVVIFGVLHHIPKWRDVPGQCHRVLRPGGRLFLEEPHAVAVRAWDRVFHWEHPPEAMFSMKELEAGLRAAGFQIARRLPVFPFRIFRAEKPPA
jgi:ubiquinone/menaquinone biosynthesis C-methylase UbiE